MKKRHKVQVAGLLAVKLVGTCAQPSTLKQYSLGNCGVSSVGSLLWVHGVFSADFDCVWWPVVKVPAHADACRPLL